VTVRVSAIVLVGPRPYVAAGRGNTHDNGRGPARLVRGGLRQIDEQVDLRDRLGAARQSGPDGEAKADFEVRLVLDARVQGALAVLLGRHERLLALRDALVQDDAIDAFPVEWDVDLGLGAHSNAGRAYGVRPSDERHHLMGRGRIGPVGAVRLGTERGCSSATRWAVTCGAGAR